MTKLEFFKKAFHDAEGKLHSAYSTVEALTEELMDANLNVRDLLYDYSDAKQAYYDEQVH